MDKVIGQYIEQFTDPAQRLGATYVPGEGTHIRLWAPHAQSVQIEWIGQTPVALTGDDGYFTGRFPDRKPGDRYWFHLDGKTRIADPASRFQPEDTTGPSEVVAFDFAWSDQAWRGVPFSEWVIYEIHTGTYSPSHDFQGLIADLPRLKNLGITTLEIMPVSQFSGARNWGYDGVFPHAVQHSYGGPRALKKLVDACHAKGLAVILDVVYNHVGPEGNTLFRCGPYAQSKYKTPWGEALNFDGPGSGEVRRYFLQSAWQWLTEYHFDGLRLDATQTILDISPIPFLEELSHLKNAAERETDRSLVLTAETDMNDPRLLAPPSQNGLGMDAHWADDLHHTLHAALTGERNGYYADYTGGAAQLAKIYERGVAFENEYSPFRKRRHGRSYEGLDKKRLIVEAQNHDQIGNRLKGDRLYSLVGFEKAKVAAACVLLSPFTPFLFMGEELAVETPFTYFVSHHDPELLEAVRKGRADEWKDFGWKDTPPDPASDAVFEQCVLTDKYPQGNGRAAIMQDYYRALITLSKRIRGMEGPKVEFDKDTQLIRLVYKNGQRQLTALLSFNSASLNVQADGRCIFNSGLWQPGQDAPKYFPEDSSLTLPPFSVAVMEM